MKRGRKNKYETHVEPFLKDIPYWRREGLREIDIAKRLDISYRSFCYYKNRNLQLMQALKKGKDDLVHDIEDSLFKRALGYEYEETKTYIEKDDKGKEKKKIEKTKKHITPDTAAAIFALKNLAPDKWRDKQTLEHGGAIDTTGNYAYMTDEEIQAEIEKYKEGEK